MIATLLAALAVATSAPLQQQLPDLPEVPTEQPAAEDPPLLPLPELPQDPAPSPKTKAQAARPAQKLRAKALAEPVKPADVPWAGSIPTRGGSIGGLALPTLATPGAGRLQIAAALDYYRGGDFLFPASTSQRTGWALAASYGALSWLETFGSLWFHSTNLFAPAARHTLGSYGDLDAGVKLSLPRRGPLSGGLLVELDVPAGIGGFSLKGVGGRAAMIAGVSGGVGPLPISVTALAGYRVDNSSRLQSATPTTFAAYALGVSQYDRVEAGLAVALPFSRITPSVELEVEAPVARQAALPPGGTSLFSRLTMGAQAQLPGGVAVQAGLRWSLSREGRLSDRSLPMYGFAQESPWQIFTGLSFQFEPRLPRLPSWSRDKRPELSSGPVEHAPAAPTPARAVAQKAKLVIVATDARSRLPVAGAWITFVDSGDAGATTGPDGKARFEHEAGAVTVAVAHEKYELWTEPLNLVAGEEKLLVVLLQDTAADATIRGRILGEDGAPLRAQLVFASAAAGKAEAPRWFEAAWSVGVPHGQFTLRATTPGYRADLVRVDVRPGETVTQDVILRRIAGEPTGRATPKGLEIARPLPFVTRQSALFPVAFPVVAELAELIRQDGRAFIVEIRVDSADVSAGGDLELKAQALSSDRARALVKLLEEKGVPAGRLTARGGGLERGLLPLEITFVPEEARPRSSTQPSPAAVRTAALGDPP